MNIGDTFDVPLHAQVSETSENLDGDSVHKIVVVCNGLIVAQLEIVFFESANPSEDEKRDMIRRSIAACLAGAVNRAEQVTKRVSDALTQSSEDFN
jgi:hypothetical protein